MPVWQHTGLTLDCYPKVPAHVSLPWDAADEYLLEHCNHSASISTLLLNDRHGALSCALPHAASYNDSASGRIATQRNRALNHSAQADFVDSPVIAQQVLIKIPRYWDMFSHTCKIHSRCWCYCCYQCQLVEELQIGRAHV